MVAAVNRPFSTGSNEMGKQYKIYLCVWSIRNSLNVELIRRYIILFLCSLPRFLFLAVIMFDKDVNGMSKARKQNQHACGLIFEKQL